MALVGSELTGLGSVLTATGAPPAGPGGGITRITSTGGTVAVTNPTGPTVNLEVSGSFPGFDTLPPPAVGTGAVGTAPTAARGDHTHDGVTTVNGASGVVTVVAFPGFGGAPPAVGTSAAGTATTASHSDHTHTFPALTGPVTTVAGSFATTIGAGQVTLTNLATEADQTVLGNGSGGAASPVALVISAATGLVADATTLKNTLSVGVASASQGLIFSTLSGGGGAIQTTTNATKGVVTIDGASVLQFSSATKQLMIGGTTTATTSALVASQWTGNTNTNFDVWNVNSSSGSSATAGFVAGNGTPTGGSFASMKVWGQSHGTIGSAGAFSAVFEGNSNTVVNSSNNLYLTTGGSYASRVQVTTNGSVIIGTGLATTATDGYLYFNSSAGNPTGVPTTQNSGASIAAQIDRTNNRLNFYANGAWQGVPGLATTASGVGTALFATAPAGIVSLNALWFTFKDAAGVTSYFPYFQ